MTADTSTRRLAAILFTDIVGSTSATAQNDQRAGLALRERHLYVHILCSFDDD